MYTTNIDESTPPTLGSINNTKKFNYEAIGITNEAFSYLPG